MMIRSAVLAFCCVLGCVHSSVFGQISKHETRDYSLSKKYSRQIFVGKTNRTIRVIPRAKDLDADVGGTFIDLGFNTSVKAATLVSLTKKNGPLPPGTESFKWTPVGTQHDVQFVDLEANTEYEIRIDLLQMDQNGGPEPEQTVYSFKTLQRHVFVALEEVFVFDDVDWSTAGDLDFGVQIGDEHADFTEVGNSWDFLNFFTKIDSGTGLNIPQSGMPNYLYQNNVRSTTMKIAVSANERDSALGQFAFRPEIEDVFVGSGCDAYNEWNSDFILIDIGHTFLTPNGSTLHQKEALVRDFEVNVEANSNSDLSYVMKGQLVVAYW